MSEADLHALIDADVEMVKAAAEAHQATVTSRNAANWLQPRASRITRSDDISVPPALRPGLARSMAAFAAKMASLGAELVYIPDNQVDPKGQVKRVPFSLKWLPYTGEEGVDDDRRLTTHARILGLDAVLNIPAFDGDGPEHDARFAPQRLPVASPNPTGYIAFPVRSF